MKVASETWQRNRWISPAAMHAGSYIQPCRVSVSENAKWSELNSRVSAKNIMGQLPKLIGRYIRDLSLLALCPMYDLNAQHQFYSCRHFIPWRTTLMKISKSFVFLWRERSSNKLAMKSIWIDNSYFSNKLPSFWHFLTKNDKKIETVMNFMYLQGRNCVSAWFGKSFAKCLLSEFSIQSSSKKWYLRLYLTQIIHSNDVMLFAWWKNCLSKFLWCAAHVFFTSRKISEKFFVSHTSASRLQDVYF